MADVHSGQRCLHLVAVEVVDEKGFEPAARRAVTEPMSTSDSRCIVRSGRSMIVTIACPPWSSPVLPPRRDGHDVSVLLAPIAGLAEAGRDVPGPLLSARVPRDAPLLEVRPRGRCLPRFSLILGADSAARSSSRWRSGAGSATVWSFNGTLRNRSLPRSELKLAASLGWAAAKAEFGEQRSGIGNERARLRFLDSLPEQHQESVGRVAGEAGLCRSPA